MASVKYGSKVTLSYIGTLDDGTIFHSTEEHAPLVLTVGAQEVFPALEEALLGMCAGEAKNVVLSADQCYGPRKKANILQVARSAFPVDRPLSLGQKLSIDFAGGKSRIMKVAALTDDAVTLDGNHALAGFELTFALRIDKVE
jgi:FKBP-type peptidyl-prolyl cis-trans isomerase 2